MIKETLLVIGVFAASTGSALAQHSPGSPEGSAHPPPKHGPPSPPEGHHGPPPPPPKGFDLKTGKDNGLRVDCGNEPLKKCIDAAKPLLDYL